MTIEQLEERLTILQSDKEKLIAQVNMYNGAIQECQYWLEQLQKTEEEKE